MSNSRHVAGLRRRSAMRSAQGRALSCPMRESASPRRDPRTLRVGARWRGQPQAAARDRDDRALAGSLADGSLVRHRPGWRGGPVSARTNQTPEPPRAAQRTRTVALVRPCHSLCARFVVVDPRAVSADVGDPGRYGRPPSCGPSCAARRSHRNGTGSCAPRTTRPHPGLRQHAARSAPARAPEHSARPGAAGYCRDTRDSRHAGRGSPR